MRSPNAIVLLSLAALLTAGVCPAHPIFESNSVVNAASFMPAELPGGRVARGSIFSVFGTLLGPTQQVRATSFPLQPQLGGVSIVVSGGGISVPAYPLFVSDTQINAVMPSDAPLGDVRMTINFDQTGDNLVPVFVTVVESSPGLFTINSSGAGPGIIQNFVSEGEQPLNSTLKSARPGQYVTLWATGLGGIDAPDNEAAPAGNLTGPFTVLIGGKPASKVLYAGRSPCCSGVDQIVVQVPKDTPGGCYVPVMVRSNGLSSNAATMAVSAGGGACSDPLNPFLDGEVGKDGRIGVIALTRNTVQLSPSGAQSVTDTAAATFQTLMNRPWFFSPAVSVPALGSCTTYTLRNQSGGLPNPPPAAPVDAGRQIFVRGPNGARSIPRTNPGFYAALFATSRQPPLFLDAGAYTLETEPGGGDARLDAHIELPPSITWSNQSQISAVDRSRPLTLTWSGGDATREYVRILAVSESSPNPENNISGIAVCTSAVEAGSFTIPEETLANLPQSVTSGALSTGFLFVGTSPLPQASQVTVEGLDSGFVSYNSMVGKAVEYK